MSDEDGVHRYRARCRWKGSTGMGYDSYERGHEVVCNPADEALRLSSDAAFLGDSSLLNPEQLMVAAASSCQLLSFLAVAARARVDIASYVDDAEAEMPERGDQMSIERIMLRPHIVVRPGTSITRLQHLVEVAHRECYIANSLRTEVIVTPTFETRDAYSFRDGDTAAIHRAIAARIFDSPSREFIAAAISDLPAPPRVAVDLGCGPGHSTRLLAEITGAQRTIGLDTSEPFLELARSAGTPRVDYVLHDLRRPGWPVGDGMGSGSLPELAYGRLVLAHLPDPVEITVAWLEELGPGGRLLIDELEWIRTDEPVLAHYLDLVTELVAAHGSAMFAGPSVSTLEPSLVGRRISNEVREWPVPVSEAAEMFAVNLSVWNDDPVVSHYIASPEELSDLADGLEELANGRAGGRIVWGLRQVVFERVE